MERAWLSIATAFSKLERWKFIYFTKETAIDLSSFDISTWLHIDLLSFRQKFYERLYSFLILLVSDISILDTL